MSPGKARLLTLAALVLVVSAGVLAALEYDKLRREFSEQVTLSESRAVRDALGMFLAPPLAALQATGKLLAQSGGGRTPAEALLVTRTALADEPGLACAVLTDASGVLAMACRDGQDALTFLRPATGLAGGVWERTRPGGAAIPAASAADMKALGDLLAEAASTQAPGHPAWPAWTWAHRLPGLPGHALSALVPAGAGGDASLLAFSFSLDSLRAALDQALPEGARALLFTSGGQALRASLGTGATGPDGEALFAGPEALDDPLLQSALTAWIAAGKPSGEAFAFTRDGEEWWAAVNALRDDDVRTLAGMALPRRALFELLFRGNRAPLYAGAGLAMAVLLLASLAVAARGRKRRAQAFFEAEAEVEALLAAGESETLEFKSTLRFNLAAGRPGKEIEMASMKAITAFMNSSGGVLAVGVDDQGEPLGLEPDGFENEDHLLRHFTSLFAQHVGIEFLGLAAFGMRSCRGRRILLVRCAPSREPVILKGGKEEEFYLRAGPSSRKLSLSDVLRHVAKGRREL
ncbi:hypothetical protein NNJEOMEG_01486 [Fundidesulfovibrio magnetotacticus]|uniref:Schlafen AlbA-2 domain-containing protein n=1 Tax=Fundidesulfovibrio magnetotacticus TaxID=2730080 RepID=A0A6V8LLV6_9BACT|nr:ATP-binding protein [Fundidesulfovibrio magnetotacticus]GFK93652.1 hypothetical protein NNJEOMEG_01486 [Fundidesulfovibrio magnetotacticus]